MVWYKADFDLISILALREEGDRLTLTADGMCADFYPRPP